MSQLPAEAALLSPPACCIDLSAAVKIIHIEFERTSLGKAAKTIFSYIESHT